MTTPSPGITEINGHLFYVDKPLAYQSMPELKQASRNDARAVVEFKGCRYIMYYRCRPFLAATQDEKMAYDTDLTESVYEAIQQVMIPNASIARQNSTP